MEEKQAELELSLPDRETFERVWRRVMPDQELSRVEAGEPAAPEGQMEERTGGRAEDEALLLKLLPRIQAGAVSAQSLARRAGGRGRQLAEVAAGRQRGARQLAALYFLLTGRRCPADRTAAAIPPSSLPAALREQYLWERDWGRACRAGAERAADGDLRELLGELAGDSALHSRLVRTALERLGPGGALTEPDRPG